MTNIVAFAKVLGDATRWRIVRLVLENALCVCELADILVMPQSSVSSHVQILRKAGLLESEKAGKWTYFRIGKPHRKIIRDLARCFDDSSSRERAKDSAKAVARLAIRAQSCCPGPRVLVSHRKNPNSVQA
ncbi:MAG: metalloregulator ArsR/SmtB family transcription factor [Verrucomicrobiota bacterium]